MTLKFIKNPNLVSTPRIPTNNIFVTVKVSGSTKVREYSLSAHSKSSFILFTF